MLALMLVATAAQARDSLGMFDDWGAFRDPPSGSAPLRCYAIAEPASGGSTIRYATIGFWPASRVRGQVHVRLAQPLAPNRGGTLSVGERRFALIVRGTSAWSADTRMDAAIVAAIRSSQSMRIDLGGGGGSARWRLRGAATAIDAAALGCANRG